MDAKPRRAAVAGTFYPGDALQLQSMITQWLEAIPTRTQPAPKAIIAPHAGYV